MSIKVKRATTEDVKDISVLFDAYRVYYKQISDIDLAVKYLSERIENDESVIFVAQSEHGEAVGFTQLYPTFSSLSACTTWVLNDLFVASTARRLGAGKKLMDAARGFVTETGANGIALETDQGNVKAQALYESLGYEKNRDHYFYFLDLTAV